MSRQTIEGVHVLSQRDLRLKSWCGLGNQGLGKLLTLPPPLAFNFLTSLPMKAAIPRLERSARFQMRHVK